jgi:hypothetical protein
LDIQLLGTHGDNVIDQVVDQVAGDGGDMVMLKGEFLLGTGFLGLQDQYGLLIPPKSAGHQTREGANPVEHPWIARVNALGQLPYSDVSAGKIHACLDV